MNPAARRSTFGPSVGPGGRSQVSNEGAATARWKKPDEIVFQSGRKIMSVHVRTSPTFSADPPRVLLEGPYTLADVMPDGDRFLVFESGKSENREVPLRLVLNWFPEVAEKMAK